MPRIFGCIGTQIGKPVGSVGGLDKQVLEKYTALGKELAKAVLQ